MSLLIKNVFIDGPDCSGKTTLIESIHKKTNYRYHIMDRSQISRSIFANLYGRNILHLEESLSSELLNLNNVYIILLPDLKIILERYKKRGDEKHDESSLKEVYFSFKKNVMEKYVKFPNVFIIENHKNVLNYALSYLESYQNSTLEILSQKVYIAACASKDKEAMFLNFELSIDNSFPQLDLSCLDYEKEKEYYRSIFKKLCEKIENEKMGKNEYKRKESNQSRRFIYTSDTCISTIHTLIRGDKMIFDTTLRSSDTKNIFLYDLKFLYFLCYTLKTKYFKKVNSIYMRFKVNSAHVL